MLTTAALVPAAGRGERLGGGVPKACRPLDGEPMVVHCVRSLLDAVSLVVVAAPPGKADALRSWFSRWGKRVVVVDGGATRQESVRLALAVVPAEVDVVLVHDAARPLAPVRLIQAVVDAVANGADAVVPALAVADTVKAMDGSGRVLKTFDRSELRAIQTPQG